MIALIGFMGSGKSSLAHYMAKKTKIPVFETDEIVYRISGLDNMSQVFAKGGDNYLRELEYKALQQIQSTTNPTDQGIVDCGGGLVTYQPSRDKLAKIVSKIILLDAPFELVKARVSNEGSRPLFTDIDQAHQLYETRRSVYSSVANDVISVTGQPLEELAKSLEELL